MTSETRVATGLIGELHGEFEEPYDGGAATVAFNAKPYGLDGGHALDTELASQDYVES